MTASLNNQNKINPAIQEMQQIEQDPNFQNLSENAQLEIRRSYDQDFAALNPQAQAEAHRVIMGEIKFNQMPTQEVFSRAAQRGALNLGANALGGVEAGVQGTAQAANPVDFINALGAIPQYILDSNRDPNKKYNEIIPSEGFNKAWNFIPNQINNQLSNGVDFLNGITESQSFKAPESVSRLDKIHNIGDFGRYAVNTLGEQVPQQASNLAAILATKGEALLPMLGLTEAGSQYNEMKKKGVKDGLGAWQYGIGSAQLENAFDPLINAFKVIPGKKLLKELNNPTFANGVKNNIKKILKAAGSGSIMEPTEEALQQIYSNIVSKAAGIKTGIFDNVPDVLVPAAIGGAVFGGGAKAITNKSLSKRTDETLSELDSQRADAAKKVNSLKEELGAYQAVSQENNSGFIPKTYDNQSDKKYAKVQLKLKKQLNKAESQLAEIEEVGDQIVAKSANLPVQKAKKQESKIDESQTNDNQSSKHQTDDKGRIILRSSKGTPAKNEVHAKNIAKVHNLTGKIEKAGDDFVITPENKEPDAAKAVQNVNEAGHKVLKTTAEKYEHNKAKRDAEKQGHNPRHVEYDDKSQNWVINPDKRSPEVHPKKVEFKTKKEAEIEAKLSDEQKDKLADLKAEHEDRKAKIKNSALNYQEKDSKLKAAGMQYAAKKREIIQGDNLDPVPGGLTAKELDNKKKYLASNYFGKKVSVDGVNGTVQGTAFDKVMVAFSDGSVKTVHKSEINAPLVKSGNETITTDQKDIKDELFNLLSDLTGKNSKYLKMIISSESSNISVQKRKEAIRELIENIEDTAKDKGLFGKYQELASKVGIDTYSLSEELNGDKEFAQQVIDAIENKAWENQVDETLISDYETEQAIYESKNDENQERYEKLSSDSTSLFYDKIGDNISTENINNAYTQVFEYVTQNIDEDFDPDYASKVLEDLDNVFYETIRLAENRQEQPQGSERSGVQDEGSVANDSSNGQTSETKEGSREVDSPTQPIKEQTTDEYFDEAFGKKDDDQVSSENFSKNVKQLNAELEKKKAELSKESEEDVKSSDLNIIGKPAYTGKSGSRQYRYDIHKYPTEFADGTTPDPNLSGDLKQHYEDLQQAIIQNKTVDLKVDPSEPTIDGYDRDFSPLGFTVTKKGDVLVFGARKNLETGAVENKTYRLDTVLGVSRTQNKSYLAPAHTLKDGTTVIYDNSYKAAKISEIASELSKKSGIEESRLRNPALLLKEDIDKLRDTLRKNKEIWKELARLNGCYE